MVVQAALDRQGVAPGRERLVAPLLADGRLVVVGGPALRTTQPFVLLHRRGPVSSAVAALCDWLLAEAA